MLQVQVRKCFDCKFRFEKFSIASSGSNSRVWGCFEGVARTTSTNTSFSLKKSANLQNPYNFLKICGFGVCFMCIASKWPLKGQIWSSFTFGLCRKLSGHYYAELASGGTLGCLAKALFFGQSAGGFQSDVAWVVMRGCYWIPGLDMSGTELKLYGSGEWYLIALFAWLSDHWLFVTDHRIVSYRYPLAVNIGLWYGAREFQPKSSDSLLLARWW